MVRLLLMEGGSAPLRARAQSLGQETSGEIYARALRAEWPDITIDTFFGADEGATPPHPLDRYDGFVISGSALHAYEEVPEVTRQIEWVCRVGETGMPMLGSCWGLQIASVAAGGEVARNPARAEMGVARKIVPTGAGAMHPLMAGRIGAFDAPCIHYDDVVRLPQGSVLLATNAHCPVQAALIPVGRSRCFGLQYHPEFDLPHLAAIFEGYADTLGQFFETRESLAAHAEDLRRAAQAAPDSPLAWRLGLDADILDDRVRRTELRNWLEAIYSKRGAA